MYIPAIIAAAMSDPLHDLERIAAELAPCSTLLVTPAGHALEERLRRITPLQRCNARDLIDQAADWPRQRLGLVAQTLEHLSVTEGQALLATLRDRLTETLYCLADPEHWPPERMLAMGLRPLGTYPRAAGGAALYHFDLHDYKRTPDWLNPGHWAHPELWNRYRW